MPTPFPQDHDELERLLRQRIDAQQPTDVPLLDDLANAQAKPADDFTRSLEAQLMQHWYDRYESGSQERPMTYEDKSKRKQKQDNPFFDDPEARHQRSARRSLVGMFVAVLIVFGTGVAGVFMMSMRMQTVMVTDFGSPSYGGGSNRGQNALTESTAELIMPERTADATRVVFIDPTVPPFNSGSIGSGTATPFPTTVPTIDDPVIQAATDIVATVTQQSINATGTAGGIISGAMALPTTTLPALPTAVQPLPTHEDPLIQKATDLVATVTQETLNLTATANALFAPEPTPTLVPPDARAAIVDIPQNWLTLGVPLARLESTDGRVVQGGVVRLIGAADSAIIVNLALVVDQRQNLSGTGSDLYFAVSPQDGVSLVQAMGANTPLRIEVISESGLVPVIAARQDIPVGTTLSADMLIQTFYPLDAVPPSYHSIEEAVGRITRYETRAGSPVVSEFVAVGGESSNLLTATPLSSGFAVPSEVAVVITSPTAIPPNGLIVTAAPSNGSISLPLTATPVPSRDTTTAVDLDAMATLIIATITQQALITPSPTAVSAQLCKVIVVNETGAALHQRPSSYSPVQARVLSHVMLPVLQQALSADDGSPWYYVQLVVGQESIFGWIKREYTVGLPGGSCPELSPAVTVTPEVLCRVQTRNTDDLILRDEPVEDAERVAMIPANTQVDVIEHIFDKDVRRWYRVRVNLDGSDVVGWVDGTLMMTDGDPFCAPPSVGDRLLTPVPLTPAPTLSADIPTLPPPMTQSATLPATPPPTATPQ